MTDLNPFIDYLAVPMVLIVWCAAIAVPLFTICKVFDLWWMGCSKKR